MDEHESRLRALVDEDLERIKREVPLDDQELQAERAIVTRSLEETIRRMQEAGGTAEVQVYGPRRVWKVWISADRRPQ